MLTDLSPSGANPVALSPLNLAAGSDPAGERAPRAHRLPPHDGITLLRALTCLSIVVAHLQPGAGGWPPFLPFQPTVAWIVSHPRPGFESFFVLAGYFLAHSFRRGPWHGFSVAGFIQRRVVRLLLPYWLILVCSWLGVNLSALHHHEPWAWNPPGFARQMLLLDNPDANELIAPQLWFMAPLLQFYLGWGLCFWLARTLRAGADSHAAALKVMLGLCATVFVLSTGADAFVGGLDYTLLTNAHYLALGLLVYWCTNSRLSPLWLLAVAGVEVGLGLSVNQSRPIAAAGTCLLLAWSANRVYAAGPRLRWLLYVGTWSYSIYLTHLFVGWRVMGWFDRALGSAADFPGENFLTWTVGVAGCVACGYLYHRLVENPCARWARQIDYRKAAGA